MISATATSAATASNSSRPDLDQMAAEGMRFTHFYAGAPVCAPSRAVLMTGRHVGHTSIRGNAGGKNVSNPEAMRPQTLRPDETTIPEMLKKSGYSTALVGKWGIGELSSGSEPTHRGFDYFYGTSTRSRPQLLAFLPHSQRFAGRPAQRGARRRSLRPGLGNGEDRLQSRQVHRAGAAMARGAEGSSFFPLSRLHHSARHDEATKALGNGQEVPNLGIYADKDWTEPNKGQRP